MKEVHPLREGSSEYSGAGTARETEAVWDWLPSGWCWLPPFLCEVICKALEGPCPPMGPTSATPCLPWKSIPRALIHMLTKF